MGHESAAVSLGPPCGLDLDIIPSLRRESGINAAGITQRGHFTAINVSRKTLLCIAADIRTYPESQSCPAETHSCDRKGSRLIPHLNCKRARAGVLQLRVRVIRL